MSDQQSEGGRSDPSGTNTGGLRAAAWLSKAWTATLSIGAVCLLCASAAGFLGRVWWVFDLASHFCVQYLVVGVAGLVVAMLAFRWRAAVLFSIGVALNVFLVYPFYAAAPETATQGDALRVFTINVNAGNRSELAVRQAINEADADVVLILEYSWFWKIALQSLDEQYPFSHHFPREGNFGVALFSRLPIKRCEPFVLGRPGFVAVDAVVEQGDREWNLLGVHVVPPVSASASALRNQQFRELADRVRERAGPLVVVGDLNCTAWSPHFRQLLQSSGLVNSQLGHGVQPTWPHSRVLRIPIDHCLVSRGIVVFRRRIVGPFGSDHRGVVAELAMRR